MRVFIIAAVIFGLAATGLEPSIAQTSAPTLPSVAVTSPLNQSVTNMTGLQSNPDNVGTANSAPCSSANSSMPALPTFDGGGLNLGSTGATSNSCGTSTSTGSGMIASPTPNTSAPTSASSAGSTSADTAAAASSLGTSAGGTTGGGPAGLGTGGLGPGGLGAGGLGTGSLGAVGLGTASLGSQSSSQTASASTGVAGSSTFCSAGSGASTSANMSITNMNMSAGDAGTPSGMTIDIPQGTDASGLVRDPAAGVVSGPYDPAETLAGEARVPVMNAAGAPCLIGE
jgi:hypothetical protein